MASATRYRILLFGLALLVLIAVPTRPVGVADGLPADHPLDLWLVLLLAGGFFVLPWRIEPRRAHRLALALLVVALAKLAVAAVSLPHGLAARYYANATFHGPPEASTEYRLAGATRLDRTIAFAPVGFAWGAKPFPLWFFNDIQRFNFYRPTEPDRRRLPFSVRWDGFIRAPTTEPLAWRLVTEQEATLHLLGQPIVSTTGGPAEAAVALTPGWHPISLTYVYRGQGPKSLRLEWDQTGAFRPIPSSALLPFRPSRLADRWDQGMALPGWVVFVLQFLVVGWVVVAGLWGIGKEGLLTQRAAVYLLVVVMVAFGTISLAKRGRAPGWNVLNGGDDPLLYETAARQMLLDRDLLNRMGKNKPFYFTVGYRYYLAAAHALLGESKAMIVMTHYILLAVASALLYWLVRCLAPPGPALFAAALLFAGRAHGTVYRWATELFPTMLGLALTAATLLALARWERRPTLRGAAGSGALAGLAAIVRPNLLVLLPLALLWMGLTPPPGRPRRWQGAAVALLAAALTIAPVTWRNWHVAGEFVLINKGGGINFWQGNQPPPEVDLSRVGNDPFYQRLGASRLTQEVLEFIRQQPMTFLAGLGRKGLQVLGLPPFFLLSILALHLGYLAGATLHWRWGRDRWLAVLLHGFVLSQWALLILLKPWPHMPKNQMPTFVVAFPFAALLLVATTRCALGGELGLSLPAPAQPPSVMTRLLAGAAAGALITTITYPPRLPLLLPLLVGVAWTLRPTSPPPSFSLDQ